MASFRDHPNAVYNDDDDDDIVLDDEDDADPDDSDDESDDANTNSTSSAAAIVIPAVPLSSSSAAVSFAVLPPSAPTNGSNRPPPPPPSVTHALASSSSSTAAPATAVVAMAAPNALAVTPVSERKPIDDSRRLFQRLWTDEDEIELLQGFLDYTTQRGPNWSGHHHDTTAFYDQIKSKLQLDCNKNQLVEKLRRLKKKYRNVVGRISSGKDFTFKSPHDQATFEISRKIWSNSIGSRPEFDDDDQNPNPSSAAAPPFIANLNSASDHRTPGGFTIDVNSPHKMTMMMNMATPPPNSSSRKRSRVKMEEKSSRNVNSVGYEPVILAPVAPPQVSVEETMKSCLSPLLLELIDNAMGSISGIGLGGAGGARGIDSLALNAIPMNFPRANLRNGGEMMEERWRKQQILELEVYSKRLELVQDQIKSTLEDLRTRGN